MAFGIIPSIGAAIPWLILAMLIWWWMNNGKRIMDKYLFGKKKEGE